MSAEQPTGSDMPADEGAEQHVLAVCLLDGDTLKRARAAYVTPESFTDIRIQLPFARACELADLELPVSADALLLDGKSVPDRLWFMQVTDPASVPTTAFAGEMIGRVVELAAKRALIRNATSLIERARNGTELKELVELARDIIPTDAPAGASRTYTVWSVSQLLAFNPDLAALLGDGYLEHGEWTSLVGVGGLGKTRLALWLCIRQIIGKEWCGLATAGAPQKCLVLSTESGLKRWQTDLEKMLATLTPSEREAVEANLRVLALTPEEEGDMNLGDAQNVARLIATLRAEKPGIVVFDPFADMVDGDENSTADLVATLRTLRRVHRTGCPHAAVLILHHARTGSGNVVQAGDNYSAGNFGRGSKALYSRVRCELQLAPGDRDDGNLLVLACGKANNSEKFKPRGIVFDPETFTYSVDSSFDLEGWRSDVAGKRGNKTASVVEVVTALRELCPHPGDVAKAGAICQAVAEATGASVRTIKTRIGEAVKAGYLRKTATLGAYALGSKPLKK